jgi:hypothetical protein
MRAVLNGEGSLSASIQRDIRTMGAQLDGEGTLTARMGRFRIDEIEYNGVLNPGDRIVIDSKNLTFTKNGVNALHEMQGEFFTLNLGENAFLYTDGQSGRSVLIRVTHRDKFV